MRVQSGNVTPRHRVAGGLGPPVLCGLMVACATTTPVRAAGEVAGPCHRRGTVLVVDTQEGNLLLCEDGQLRESYSVALGRGGVDKRRVGDLKTPRGRYALGKPRPSERFHLFIPIGYPTPEQQSQGYTGYNIGIHGPDRRASWLGALSTWVDWTQGCVAVGSDDAIEEVARWVTVSGAARVDIE